MPYIGINSARNHMMKRVKFARIVERTWMMMATAAAKHVEWPRLGTLIPVA